MKSAAGRRVYQYVFTGEFYVGKGEIVGWMGVSYLTCEACSAVVVPK
jgi:hypothetical protein